MATSKELDNLGKELEQNMETPWLTEQVRDLPKTVPGAFVSAGEGLVYQGQRIAGTLAQAIGEATNNDKLIQGSIEYLKDKDLQHELDRENIRQDFDIDLVETGSNFAGQIVPYVYSGPGGWGKLAAAGIKRGAQWVGEAALAGGLHGLFNSQEEEFSGKFIDAAKGAGWGAFTGAALGVGSQIPKVAKWGYRTIKPNDASLAEDAIKTAGVTADDLANAKEVMAAGKRLGSIPSPGEALNNPILKEMEKYGQGARQAVKSTNIQKQLDNIDELLQSPNKEKVYSSLSKSTKNLADDLLKERRAVVDPLYAPLDETVIDPGALNSVLSDPKYSEAALQAMSSKAFKVIRGGSKSPDTAGYWHAAVRTMKSIANSTDITPTEATIYRNAASALQNKLPKGYLLADDTYRIMSDKIATKGYNLAKDIKDIPADQRSQLGKMLFENTEVDLDVVKNTITALKKANPKATEGAAKIYMKEKLFELKNTLDPRTAAKGRLASPEKFYDTFLAKPNQYEALHAALPPSQQQRLADMRTLYGAWKQAKITPKQNPAENFQLPGSGNQVPLFTYGINRLRAMLNPKYNEQAVEFITSPRWEKAYQNILSRTQNNPTTRALNVMKLVSQIPVSYYSNKKLQENVTQRLLDKEPSPYLSETQEDQPEMRMTPYGPKSTSWLQSQNINPDQYEVLE